jgi:hypothetical protein
VRRSLLIDENIIVCRIMCSVWFCDLESGVEGMWDITPEEKVGMERGKGVL